MSYQTKKSSRFGLLNKNYCQSSGRTQNVGDNIGQSRPVLAKSFVPGGQVRLNPLNKQGGILQQQHAGGQTINDTNTGIHFSNQQKFLQTQLKQELPPTSQAPQQQEQQQPFVNQEDTKPDQKMIIDEINNISISSDDRQQNMKPQWTNSGNKISKKERIRRRNIRMSKMLQPKNALMVLHELFKNANYDVIDCLVNDEIQFKACVVIDGLEHVGYGCTKNQAKNAAAEMALKHFVTYKKLSELNGHNHGNNDDGEKMDVSQPLEEKQQPLPWQHVASFALYKLFASWFEDPEAITVQVRAATAAAAAGSNNVISVVDKIREIRPANKLPENPETLNPLMLINQMLPHAQFEEMERTGHPSNEIFSFKCTVDNDTFIGAGHNKKMAKKNAAFAACQKMLSINYPPDIYLSPLC